MILCSAAPYDWDYHGITGIIGDILALKSRVHKSLYRPV